MPKEMRPKEMGMRDGGHLYMQTNEIQNCVIRYRRSASGALSEVERCFTSGAGSGTFKPISGQESGTKPNRYCSGPVTRKSAAASAPVPPLAKTVDPGAPPSLPAESLMNTAAVPVAHAPIEV